MRFRAALTAACLSLTAGGAPVHAQAPTPVQVPAASTYPGRDVSLPASEVKDTFFAYILGIIQSGIQIDIDNEQMRSILVEFTSALHLPFDLISRVSQHEDPGTSVRVISLEFQRDVVIPIPFSLLWYHPGTIAAAQTVAFEVQRWMWAEPGTLDEPADVLDLVLVQGSILVDIDDWLEALFSATLQDSWIHHIVFFKWHGDWVGMLEGIGRRDGRVMRAYFDFRKNAILFPPPGPLDEVGKIFVPDSSP
jgi:hypothetical protein